MDRDRVKGEIKTEAFNSEGMYMLWRVSHGGKPLRRGKVFMTSDALRVTAAHEVL